MKILIADAFEQSGVDGLKAIGCDVVYEPDLKDAALVQAINETAADVLVVRHRDRPGVLAHVFHLLRNDDINVQETENIIFEGAQAAVARVNLDAAPSEALLREMYKGSSDILDLHLVTI